MFYIKTKRASGKVVNTDITDENVYTKCSDCGRELLVDLVEIFPGGESYIVSKRIVCPTCAQKIAEKPMLTEGLSITIDGLELLADVLYKVGCGEQVYVLLYKFEVEEVSELAPEQLRPFAEALIELATEGGWL